jgi:pimeloyl-ACP methyl ester carboxylesterase
MGTSKPDRHALIIRGGGFGPQAGLLAYVSAAARRLEAHVELISWTPPMDDRPLDELQPWVHEQVSSTLANLPTTTPLLIGKSLGSYAASVAADRDLPAIWLTPLLTQPACVDGLRRSTKPFLLAGGTADAFWNGALARDLTPHIIEIPNANHGLMVPGPLRHSAEALAEVLTTVETFLETSIWH